MVAAARKRHVAGKPAAISDNNSKGKKSKDSLFRGWKLLLLLVSIVALCLLFWFMYLKPNINMNGQAEKPKSTTKQKTQSQGAKKQKKETPPAWKIAPDLINEHDKRVIKELEKANKYLISGGAETSVQKYESLVNKYPNSPLAKYGKAQALENYAEELRSNEVLQNSINMYEEATRADNCPVPLQKLAYLKMADRYEFLGRLAQSLNTMKILASKIPNDVSIMNKLGVQHLMAGSNAGAKDVFTKVLKAQPDNGFAKVHLGFILKSDLKYEESIPYLEEGIQSGDPESDHARFYYHLGDAYNRVGKPEEAWRIYELGAQKGHFMSAWQRSLYNADTPLKAQPWWEPEESGHLKAIRKLEANWKTIRDEGLAILDRKTGGFLPEEENLREKGDWLQFTLYQQGRKEFGNCRRTPKTCAILDTMPEAVGCKRGQIKYSVMRPGTHVWSHTGPTNCRLRTHLGLVIPKGVMMRCGSEKRVWKEGKVIIIDDSFDHEVWNNGTTFRLIFIVDFWHPDLTAQQKATLTPI